MTRSDGVQSSSKDSKQKVTKQLLERIKEATGADEEVITHTLEQCNYDPNEATARLIENPFSEFVSKSKRKQQRAAESAKDPRIVEVKRAGSLSNGSRGGRGYGRGDRQGGDRSRSVRGTGRSETAVKPVIDESSAGTADGWDETEAAPVSAPSPSRPPPAAQQAPQQEPVRASWGRPGAPGMGTMADLLKRPPPAATAPPPEGQLPPSAPSEKQEIVGSAASSGHIAPPQTLLQDPPLSDSNNLGSSTSDAITQPLGSLQSGGGLHTLSSSAGPSSYPNAIQPIGPPSGTVVQSSSSQTSTPVHKTSTADLGGVTVDPPVRPSYQPQQDLHTNGTAQHSAWGGLQTKQSPGPSVTGAMLPNVSLSQQAPFSNQSQHQQPQQNNLGPSLLSSLTGQNNTGASNSDPLHNLSNLSTPSLSNNVGTDAQGRNSFGQERNQFSGLTHTPQQSADALQMQFGQVQLNGTDYGSGFGTGFGTSSSQNHSNQSQSHDASGPLDAELPSFLRQQPSQQPQQPQSQQPSRSSSEAATSTADALIQQHSRPLGSNNDYAAPTASRAYTAFSQQSAPSRPTQTPTQNPPASASAGIQTESTSLGNDSGNYGSYGSAQGMRSFANQHSHYNQAPSQYQSYGDAPSGTPSTAAAPSSKQPAYDSYSNYTSFAQPSFSQKPDMYGSQASHTQPQAPPSRYGNQPHTGATQSSGQGLHQNSPPSAPMQHTSSGPLLSASSTQSMSQLPQMPFAGPGGLPPGMGGGMGQYGYQAQAPAYNPYMQHQGYAYNPMQQSYGGYPQATGAYNSSGFGSNSYQQHGGHHKYQAYGNQGYGGSNGYDESSTGVYGKDRDAMYSNPHHSHGQTHRLPQDSYQSHPYNPGYKQPGHASSYGGPQGQYGMYGQQSHNQGPYHGSSQALNGGSGFGRLS